MTRSDEELMESFCEGDDRALADLYRRYRPILLAVMRKCTPPPDAEDVVQETFLRVQRARATYHRGQPVRPWLWTIAHNVRKDLARSASRRPEVAGEADLLPATDDTLRPIEQAQSVGLLRQALSFLTPALRETVERHWLQELEFEEIAAANGCRAGTLRVRAHRACSRLRQLLADDLVAA